MVTDGGNDRATVGGTALDDAAVDGAVDGAAVDGGGVDGAAVGRGGHPEAVPARARRPALLTAVAAAAAALVVLIGIGTPLLGLRSFSGVDLLQTYEPWRSSAPTGFRPHLETVSDTVDTALAGHHLFGRELAAGNLPSWNPLVSGGTAFGSGTGVAFYSPLSLPYLLLPTWLAPAFAKLLEMVVAIGGMVLLLRRLRLARPAALVGGILFASSGFMVSWTNWPHTQVAALIPALFWATERFAQKRTVPAAVPIAVVIALMLLGGFPAVAGYACYAAAPYLALRLLQLGGPSPRRLLGGGLTAGAALLLGTGAVAVVLFPFLAQLRQLDYLSDRGQTPEVHLPPLMLLTTAVWRAFGSEAGGDGYWGPISQIEGLSFLGAGALVLVGFAVLRRPAAGVARGVRGYFVAATVVTAVLGYAGGPLLALAQHLPVFSDNPVFRIRSVFGFFLAVLAAIGYDALVRHRRGRGRAGTAVAAAGWALAAAGAAVASQRLLAAADDAGRQAYAREQLLWAALPAALVLAAGVVATTARRRAGPRDRVRLLALAAVPVIVAVESLSLLLPFWPRIPRSQFYPVTAAHQFLRDNLGHERYAASGMTLFSGTNVYYGLRNATGHAFTAPEWKELLLTLDPRSFASPTFSRISGGTDAQTVGSPLLDLLAVRYFVFAPSDPVLGTGSTVGPAGPGTTLRPGQPAVVPLGTGPVRGVGIQLTRAARPADRYAALDVELVDAGGATVARSGRRLYAEVPAGRFVVPIAGEGLAGPLSARLTLRSDAPLAVAGGAAAQLTVVRPDPADRLRLVLAADGAVLYDRATALPRFRWADHVQVVPDKARRLGLLATTRDPGRVVLDGPGPARAEGRPAAVAVLEDGTDEMAVRVTASGAGYLVVADAVQDGWRATVDGRTVPLVAADHAMVAVPVPAGGHVVRLRYLAPGRDTGAVVSLLSLVSLAGMAAGPRLYRRVRPRRGPERGAAGDR